MSDGLLIAGYVLCGVVAFVVTARVATKDGEQPGEAASAAAGAALVWPLVAVVGLGYGAYLLATRDLRKPR